MKVLLDENLPHKLRTAIVGHEVETARYRGWNGLKNGELLKAAEQQGIEVLLTADQNLTYQQSMTGRKIAIVTLTAQDFIVLHPHLHQIQAAIDNSTQGSFQIVDCTPAGSTPNSASDEFP